MNSAFGTVVTLVVGGAMLACSPRSMDSDELDDDVEVPEVFVRSASPLVDGVLGVGTSSLSSFSLNEGGEGRWTTKHCALPDKIEHTFSWTRDGNTISFLGSGMDAYSTLKLSEDICERHAYTPQHGSAGFYRAGDYCPVDITDGGHSGTTCSWAACDEVAEECQDLSE